MEKVTFLLMKLVRNKGYHKSPLYRRVWIRENNRAGPRRAHLTFLSFITFLSFKSELRIPSLGLLSRIMNFVLESRTAELFIPLIMIHVKYACHSYPALEISQFTQEVTTHKSWGWLYIIGELSDFSFVSFYFVSCTLLLVSSQLRFIK